MTGMSIYNPDLIFYALGTIAVGNCLFKANPASLLAKCYERGDPRLDGAFTLFYMSINIGSLISLSLAPVIADHYGYTVTYNLWGGPGHRAADLLRLSSHGQDIGSEPDHLPLDYGKLLLVLLGSVALVFFCAWLMHHVVIANMVLMTVTLAVVIFFFREAFKLDAVARNKMYVAFVLMLEAVVFYVLYAQMPTSLNFFAINNMHHEMLGMSVNPISFQALNPFWVVVGSPVLAMIYTRLGSRAGSHHAPQVHLGHAVLLPRLSHRGGLRHLVCRCSGLTSPWFMVLIYLFQSLGS